MRFLSVIGRGAAGRFPIRGSVARRVAPDYLAGIPCTRARDVTRVKTRSKKPVAGVDHYSLHATADCNARASASGVAYTRWDRTVSYYAGLSDCF